MASSVLPFEAETLAESPPTQPPPQPLRRSSSMASSINASSPLATNAMTAVRGMTVDV